MASRKKKKPPIYYFILSLTSILLIIGVVMISSASSVLAYDEHGDSFYFMWRQLVYAVVGLAAMGVAARLDRKWFKLLSPVSVGISVALLILVAILGRQGGGAIRWLTIGGFSFQPSEFAKLSVALFAADLLSRKRKDSHSVVGLGKIFGIPLAIIFALILAQPDLGTTIIAALIVLSILFMAGIRYRELFLINTIGAVGVVGLIALEPYRRARMLAFLDPWGDKLGNGFQLVQSLLALGSGGLMGAGLGLGRQKFGYLPAPHTDFIFAVIGEELGLQGTLGLILLYILLALAIMTVIRRCDDMFGKLLATGIGTMIIGQALVNIGGVTGVLPITGVPLPLVSFGGSSLVLTLASIGVLLNISSKKAGQKRGKKSKSTSMRRRDGGARLSGARAGRSA